MQEDTQEIEINGLIEQFVEADDELLDILASSIQKRKIEKVKKDTKFASNLFVELTVTQKDNEKQKTICSKLTCIDLESPLIDISEEEAEELENGHATFSDLCNLMNDPKSQEDDSQFYSSSLSAILYSRSLHNCIATTFINCSPAIPHAAQFTLGVLEFADTALKNLVVRGVKTENLLPFVPDDAVVAGTDGDVAVSSITTEKLSSHPGLAPVSDLTKTIDSTAEQLISKCFT